MTEEEYKKLTIEEKVALANNKETSEDLIKKIIDEDDMQLKMQLMMSNQAITDYMNKNK
jgi:predicted mannosyl-3-phosphoglycerate phosphatase (HAD superfamily)